MKFENITNENYETLHALMTDYFRDGEDADTQTEIIDEFIEKLFGMIKDGGIYGCLANENGEAAGFVLYTKDSADGEFSEMPDYGTILEIGLADGFKGRGLGADVVRYAEQKMKALGVIGLYVCAYGKAETFWKRQGYVDTGKTASNSLPIYIKSV